MTHIAPTTSNSAKKKLPIGIQTFAKIRATADDYYYVDKTPLIEQLVTDNSYVFLSRPRRFGKSLTIDTIAELFAGNEQLFTGLYIENNWDWSIKHPVIRISFGGGVSFDQSYLDDIIDERLTQLEYHWQIKQTAKTFGGRLKHLIEQLQHRHKQKVVVLVDEYDKPILDNLNDHQQAIGMRNRLRDLYSAIKDSDAHIRFAMLTGVSKFSKVNLFSGLNNLTDITLDKTYSALCGYTETDLDVVFAPELDGLDREQIRHWYNGYNWGGEAVYNPFDVLLLFRNREYRAYWFETGTPTFLYDLLKQQPRYVPALSGMTADLMQLSQFDVAAITPEALLLQTGYLTIAAQNRRFNQIYYQLDFPNFEVYHRFHKGLLYYWLPIGHGSQITEQHLKLGDLLINNDFAAMRRLFTAFFASIPNDWYRNNPIAQYEGFYTSVFYAYFAALGLDITCEDVTHLGRIDMTVHFNQQHYLFEFKVIDGHIKDTNKHTPNPAMAQLEAKNYAAKYTGDGQPIHLIGVVFCKTARAVVSFDYETL